MKKANTGWTYVSTVEYELMTGADGAHIHRRPKDGSPYIHQKDIERYTESDTLSWRDYIMDTPEWDEAILDIENSYDTSDNEYDLRVKRIISVTESDSYYDMEVSDKMAVYKANLSPQERKNLEKVVRSFDARKSLKDLKDTYNNSTKKQADAIRSLLESHTVSGINQAISLAEALEDKKINDMIRDFLLKSSGDINEGIVDMTVEIVVEWEFVVLGRLIPYGEDSEEY
jgi:hypothetical protein